jgi:hypothetical protein
MKCCGLFGAIFGHCMREYLESATPPDMNHLPLKDGDQPANVVLALIDKLTVKKYAILCKRCGKTKAAAA